MPVKRRSTKRRTSPAAALVAWADVFEDGENWGGGIVDELVGAGACPRSGCPTYQEERRRCIEAERSRGKLALFLPTAAKEAADRAAYRLAGEAWQSVGDAFMASWLPTTPGRVPWALEAFGEPGGRA